MEPTTNEQVTLDRATALGLRATIHEGRVRSHELGKEEYLTFDYAGFLDYLSLLEANASTDPEAPYTPPRSEPNPFTQPTLTPITNNDSELTAISAWAAPTQLSRRDQIALKFATHFIRNTDTDQQAALSRAVAMADQFITLLDNHPLTPSQSHTDYVLGFAFTPDFKRVLLRESDKLTLPPLNDDHLWSGVGTLYPPTQTTQTTQTDPAYSFNHAMAEVFEATTGLSTSYDDWTYYSAFPAYQPDQTQPTQYQIHLFYTVVPYDSLREAERNHPGSLNCLELKEVQFLKSVNLADHVHDFIQQALRYHHSQPSEPQ